MSLDPQVEEAFWRLVAADCNPHPIESDIALGWVRGALLITVFIHENPQRALAALLPIAREYMKNEEPLRHLFDQLVAAYLEHSEQRGHSEREKS